ncbi:NTP transferase domain-containing protein [Fusobacterium sp. MFO224]|uniref:NTP transferase domain-containing protein n=1 Tax=Fusobacterium sp. MFO224 TaxID=3378070 RepID=UPI00385315A9
MNTAVVLVEERGTKLENITRGDFPKAFLPINRKPLIERTIETLNSVGIKRIILITGHLKEFFELLNKKYEGIETIPNLNYSNTGSMGSFYCAKDSIKDEEEVLLLDGDLIYEKNALEILINSQNEDAILLDEDEKPVGIQKLSNSLFEEMFEAYKNSDNLKLDYESLIFEIGKNRNISHEKAKDILWSKIDTQDDFKNVVETIYPAIIEKEKAL